MDINNYKMSSLETSLIKKFNIFYGTLLILLFVCIFSNLYINTAVFGLLLILLFLLLNIYFAVKYKVFVIFGTGLYTIGNPFRGKFWSVNSLPKNGKDLKDVRLFSNLILFLIWNIFLALILFSLWYIFYIYY